MPFSDSYQLVNVFIKANEAQGNQAAIICETSIISERAQISSQLLKQEGISTTCFISPNSIASYKVDCFNGENAIQCCGHGLIAAAKKIFTSTKHLKIIINENITATQKDNQDTVVLALPRIPSKVTSVPIWAKQLLTDGDKKITTNHAAITDKKDGYLLLEIMPELSLDTFSAMQPDIQTVCKNTKRAIVIIQFDNNNKHLYMRYFAPQYGVDEDSATGSVMRFVADYIDNKYKCVHYVVSQCSKQGGFMEIHCESEHIKITSNVKVESN